MSFSSGVALGGINNPFSRDNSLSGMDAEKNPRKRAAEDDGGAGSMTKRARQCETTPRPAAFQYPSPLPFAPSEPDSFSPGPLVRERTPLAAGSG